MGKFLSLRYLVGAEVILKEETNFVSDPASCLNPVDSAGHYHHHPHRLLQCLHLCRLLDIYDIHDHLHTAHFSSIMVSTEKGELKPTEYEH